MTTRRPLLAVALALALVVAGCGSDEDPSGDLDRNNPEAVARAYIAAMYDCGDRGAGLQWDLEIHDDPANEQTREDALRSEREKGCRPTRVPDIETIRGASQGDVVRVGIVNPDACPREGDLVLVLVRVGDGYKVDPPSVNDEVDCVENGST